MGLEDDEPIEHRWITRSIENAQKKVEAAAALSWKKEVDKAAAKSINQTIQKMKEKMEKAKETPAAKAKAAPNKSIAANVALLMSLKEDLATAEEP